MKKICLSLIILSLLFLGIDRGGGWMMSQVNRRTQSTPERKLRYMVNNIDEDVVLLGTSRVNNHYLPSIIHDSIGASVYNGGINASYCIYFQYVALCHILRHHIPKVVVLEVMRADFIFDETSFESLSYFAPYMGISPEADSVYRLAGSYPLYQISHLYRYNAKAISNIFGLFVNRYKEVDHGATTVEGAARNLQLNDYYCPQGVDSTKIAYLERFIGQCRQKGIKLVMTISPAYSMVRQDVYAPLKTIAQRHSIPLLDYHSRGTFLDHPEYFHDSTHLCHEGAVAYSQIFASDLKKILSSTGEENPFQQEEPLLYAE